MAILTTSIILKLVLTGSVIVLIAKLFQWLTAKKESNPFARDSSKPKKPLVTDQRLRDAVIKQGFSSHKVPDSLDAIVIGSGIGGLSVAAILAKSGKKCVVLEQHDQAGGCCHTYIDKGYEFDVGIHYIGQVQQQTINKTLVDQITDGQLEWVPLDDEFDVVSLGTGENNRKYPIVKGKEKWKNLLKKQFPDEDIAIDKFFRYMGEVKQLLIIVAVLKFLPVWLSQIIIRSGILNLHNSYSKFNGKSTQQVVEELTENKDLQAVLCYNFGDYGTTPRRSAFFIQALLMQHFLYGGSYPRGGASEIAFHTIPVIEASGGKVFVRAEVTRILTDDSKKVTGVRVKKGSEEVDIHAPIVISDAGLYNTFGRLLPKEIASKSYFFPIIENVKHAPSGFSVFIGLKASNEELGVKAQNFWVFKENALDKIANDYFNLTAEEAMDSEVPLLFVSFPSTKDPTWNDRYPGRSTCAVVTLSNYSWFEKWENEPVKRRGDNYDAIKNTIGQKMVEQVCEMFPQIRDKIDYVDIGSPLSNRYYIAAPRGEIYGMDHTMERFSAAMAALLRPETDIEGLFLTGQDVQSCGFVGALWGGVLASQSILKRNVFHDLEALHKQLIKSNQQPSSDSETDHKS